MAIARPSPADSRETPLLKKLGYGSGQRAMLIAVPDRLRAVLGAAGFESLRMIDSLDQPSSSEAPAEMDVVHLFVVEKAILKAALPRLRRWLAPAGMIWVSWPKKSSKVATDVDDNVVRGLALGAGLVDVKVCAVDAVWSGLKLVIPLKDRSRARAGGVVGNG